MPSSIKKILREPLFYLLPLLAVAYLIVTSAHLNISDARIIRNNQIEYIKLPHSANMGANETFFVSFNLRKNNKTTKFTIIPDDCIQEILVNGEKIPLNGVKGLCDYFNGAKFDFSKYVKEGLNHFELQMRNNGGPGGLRIEAPYNGFQSISFMHVAFTFLLLLSTALILRKFNFRVIAIFIILIGITLRLILYTYTGPIQYVYDIGGHLHYIQVIAEEKRIPKIDEGWGTYQPPSYYIASAAIKNFIDNYSHALSNRILQQFNLLLSFASIVLGVALIISLLGNRWPAYLAALVSVSWPGFVLAAPRINNDSLFYFGALFCMFFAQRYWQTHKNSYVLLASAGVATALAAKSNGLVIFGTWAIIYILGSLRFGKINSLRTLFLSISMIAVSIGFSNYRTAIDVFEGKKSEFVGNIDGLDKALIVNNTAGNYLYFDLRDYMLVPYANSRNDAGGRQYFWNFALKTSLFGEFNLWDSPTGRVLAIILSVLALLIFGLALWGIIHIQVKEYPSLLFVVFLFVALIYLRISYPYACSNDFRYIMPVLFPLAYFSMRGAQILLNSRIRKLSYIILLSFPCLSFAFIVGRAF